MEASLYQQYVHKYFPALVTNIVEKVNEQRNNPLPYLYQSLLDPVYSADGRWASILAEYTRVAADVISLGSELPVKSRDAIETAQGEIPKIGLKTFMDEKQMKDLDNMIAQNQPIGRILDVMFADLPRCIQAVYERIEDIFLSELSTGVGVSERNNGTGLRISMNFLAANQFGTAVVWSGNTATSTPLDDIQQIFDKALDDNNTITDVYADDIWLKGFYQSQQVRSQYAFNMGVTTVNNTVPVLDFDKAAAVMMSKWGVTLHRVARKVKTEINGTKKNHNPWAAGHATFVCNQVLGNLIWTTCAESTRPVAGVEYVEAGEFILASRYSTNDPLREFTSAQAMCVPVLNNVDQIYTLDSTVLQSTLVP